MSDLITRTARLVPYSKRPKQVPSFVTAYSYEPLTGEPGSELGCLYVVLEVLVSGRASEEIADLIIETAGEVYYNRPDSDRDSVSRFEAAIKSVNQALAEHVNRGNAAWIGKLSAVIAIQSGPELHVSSTGSGAGLLYRGKASTKITSEDTPKPMTPSKTFGSIASGQLEAGDRLLLATPALVHQVPLQRLHDVIATASPNAAIADLTDLLRRSSVERIAALIVEITTPELAALQVRSEEPDEIQLGMPENTIEAVKLAATPIAETTVKGSKKVAKHAAYNWSRLKPHLRRGGIATAAAIRRSLRRKSGRQALMAVAVAAVILLGALAFQHYLAGASGKVWSRYEETYKDFARADAILGSGDLSGARQAFQSVQRSADQLRPDERQIDSRLAQTKLAAGQPATLGGLRELINERLDQIDGLVKVDPVTVVNFSAKNARPEHFEISNGTAYILDDHADALSIVNLTTNTSKSSGADISRLGEVVATTLSSNNDGIYILTAEPSVWFYRFDTDTATRQTIALGQWPKATAIAAYGPNLYLLGSNTVYKHVKNATGYSPKTDYLKLSGTESDGATAIAVDGSVYMLSKSGLQRYLAGSHAGSSDAPAAISGATRLRSFGDGQTIVGAASGSKRVGVWRLDGNDLSLTHQVSLSKIKHLYDAAYVPKTGLGYALVDGRLVSFQL